MTEIEYGYYGKLPVSPEFLRWHASGPELRWLDEWLQQGILYAKAQEGAAWSERLAQASPYGFLYLPSHEGRLVCGAIRASRDQAGRAFPFLSYVLLEHEALASSPWLVPVAVAGFLKDTRIAFDRLQNGCDWDVFRRMLGDHTVREADVASARERFDQFTQTTTIRQWCFGEATHVGEARHLAAEQLVARVVRGQGQRSKGVRFPIGLDGTSGNLDLAFWLQLYLQHPVGGTQPQAGMFCCWRREPGLCTALLSLGPGSPNVVRFLVNPEAQDEAWWDLTASVPDLGVGTVEGTTSSQYPNLQEPLAGLAQFMRAQLGRIGAATERVRPESAGDGLSALVLL